MWNCWVWQFGLLPVCICICQLEEWRAGTWHSLLSWQLGLASFAHKFRMARPSPQNLHPSPCSCGVFQAQVWRFSFMFWGWSIRPWYEGSGIFLARIPCCFVCLMEWKSSSSTTTTEVCSFSIVKLDGALSTFFPDESCLEWHYFHLCKIGVIGWFCLTCSFFSSAIYSWFIFLSGVGYLVGDTTIMIGFVKLRPEICSLVLQTYTRLDICKGFMLV